MQILEVFEDLVGMGSEFHLEDRLVWYMWWELINHLLIIEYFWILLCIMVSEEFELILRWCGCWVEWGDVGRLLEDEKYSCEDGVDGDSFDFWGDLVN